MPSSTPTLPTLNYAPPSPPYVRPWPLALGTALVAAAAAISLAQNFLVFDVVHSVSLRIMFLAQSLVGLTEHSAVLAAIFLLARALPRHRRAAPRWSVLASVALAALPCLLGIFASALFFAYGHRLDGGVPPWPPWLLLAVAAWILIMAASAALVVIAALYLAALATRLQRHTLGLAAAAALIPTLLLQLYGVAYNALLLPSLLKDYPMAPAWSLPNGVPVIFRLYQLLLWSAIALFALLLALRHRSHPLPLTPINF